MTDHLSYLSTNHEAIVDDLREFVTRESPSTDKPLLDAYARFLAEYAAKVGSPAMVVSGGGNRPPMERTQQIGALFERARELAARIGLTLEDAFVGGGSDGNFCAALGIPVLDGMGAVGGGAHAASEHTLVTEVPCRTALLAALLESL